MGTLKYEQKLMRNLAIYGYMTNIMKYI